jgi:putative membrane protein
MIMQSWLPYCGPAPAPGEWLTRWNLDPLLLICLLALAAMAATRGLWRGADGGRRRRATQAAVTLGALLYVSPLCALSSAFFTVRVVHHMALVLVLAPLAAVALEPWLTRATRHLWSWTALSAATFWLWHAPGPYSAALSSDATYWLMQGSLLATGAMFWAAVRRAEPGLAIAAVLATTVQMGLLGALITFSVRPLYPPHFLSAAAWDVSALYDQQLAGVVMWAPGSFAYLLAAILIGRRWLREGNAPQPAETGTVQSAPSA